MEIYKKNQILSSFHDDHKLIHKSKHLLLELYRCDCEKLNDESFLRCTLNRAAKLANATVLNLISNKFEPQGVTAIALLAESHISIHTWPESNYSAVLLNVIHLLKSLNKSERSFDKFTYLISRLLVPQDLNLCN